MTIQSTRWPEDEKLVCPNYPALTVILSENEGALSQELDASGNVIGLNCAWNCSCKEQHQSSISLTDLAARNIPEPLQSDIVKATLAGAIYS